MRDVLLSESLLEAALPLLAPGAGNSPVHALMTALPDCCNGVDGQAGWVQVSAFDYQQLQLKCCVHASFALYIYHQDIQTPILLPKDTFVVICSEYSFIIQVCRIM